MIRLLCSVGILHSQKRLLWRGTSGARLYPRPWLPSGGGHTRRPVLPLVAPPSRGRRVAFCHCCGVSMPLVASKGRRLVVVVGQTPRRGKVTRRALGRPCFSSRLYRISRAATTGRWLKFIKLLKVSRGCVLPWSLEP